MTITIAWVRRNKETQELLIASDSRLRSRGAMDQCQKIFRLDRGDCCLGFCGDAQIAYPLFVQSGAALNNFIKTRTRASDVTDVVGNIRGVVAGLISSWDLGKKEKEEELKDTRILFAGWSWKFNRFDVGLFKFVGGQFEFHHEKARVPYPWGETKKSLTFLGDYKAEYMEYLAKVLAKRYGVPSKKQARRVVDFDYEPLEALALMLRDNNKTSKFPLIGGAPQLLKIYAHGNDLPIVIRTDKDSHFLLGRKLIDWEKTNYPLLDVRGRSPKFIYPMSAIPLPKHLKPEKPAKTKGASQSNSDHLPL
jgi:hypothetical protein